MEEGVWIRQGDDVQGPFPREQVLAWMQAGKILTNMMLSADGRNWRPAGDAADLLVPPTPTPAPVPAPTHPQARGARDPDPRRSRRRPSRGHARPARPARRSAPTGLAFGIGGAVVVLALGVVLIVGRNSDAPSEAAGDLAPGEIVARAEDSVAFVLGPAFGGTGFMVDDGVMATSANVMRTMLLTDLEVYFPSVSRQRYAVDRVLDLDDRDDICLLAVRTNTRPLTLSANSAPQTGEELVFIGNPGGGEVAAEKNAPSRALAGSTAYLDGRSFLRVRAALPPSNSGGPALDDRGMVVGLVTQRAPEPNTTVFVLPAVRIRDALARAKRHTPDEIRKLNQRQVAGAVYLRLEAAAQEYLALMDQKYEDANQAFKKGARTLEELQRHVPDHSADVARVRQRVGTDLNRYFGLVEEMRWLGKAAREELLDFQWVTQTFEGHAMSADLIALVDFLNKRDDLHSKYENLRTSLRKRFGLPPPGEEKEE